jgi:hypothetical protein
MYLFSRSTLATLGKELEAIPAAVEVGALVTKITGREVNTFTGIYGVPQGSVMWSARAESHADLQAVTEKLMVDQGYLDMLQSMQGLFMTPAEDQFSRVITDPIAAATSRFYGITRAVMASGKYGPAMEFGVEVSNYMGKALNMQSSFVKSGYGAFAGVAWILGLDSAEDIDRFDDFQMSDAGYLKLVEKAGDLFVENTGFTSLIEKIG